MMVDQINQSIDIIVPLMDEPYEKQEEEDEDNQIIIISEYQANGRPLYQVKQKRHLQLIRRQLKVKNHVLLKAFNTHAYYSCKTSEMKQKIQQHMTNTRAYACLMERNETNQHRIEKFLNNCIKRITKTLNALLYYQLITDVQMQQMIVNRYQIRLDYLYFLPDIRKENVPFRPMMVCHRSATIHISRFLNSLLQPMYNKVTCSRTFMSGMDATYAVEDYVKKGLIRSSTLFATLHIDDLCTIFPHERTMQALQRFLREYVLDGQIQGISIRTLMDLVRLVLLNQYFLYDNKLYQQIQGGNSSSPMTYLLANIYMYYWQQDLVKILDEKSEIFGRCFDQIFLTWNESEDNLRAILNRINSQYPHIQTTLFISQNIIYLDAQISHIDGVLNNSVAHNVDTEPYSLPFVYGHPRHCYSTLIRAALLRATGCCTSVSEFHNERQNIEFSFLFNNFSLNFITQKVQLFFIEFNAIELESKNNDQNLYNHLRQRVLEYNQQRRLELMTQFQQRYEHEQL